jgi:hypothetical protein
MCQVPKISLQSTNEPSQTTKRKKLGKKRRGMIGNALLRKQSLM